jgi:hypothetical protein
MRLRQAPAGVKSDLYYVAAMRAVSRPRLLPERELRYLLALVWLALLGKSEECE